MHFLLILFAFAVIALAPVAQAQAPAPVAQGVSPTSNYEVVENWAQFPEGVTKWGGATGVDIDPRNGNIYVFHRLESMPIMAFDKNGRFLRAWGQGMFKTTHFLRTDREGNVWVTDRGDHQVFKFSPEGKLLMTLGQKGVVGDNESRDAFNGVADLVIARNGDIFIADGESSNTRVVKYSKDGKFVSWWGGLGKEPGKFDEPHSIAIDSDGRLYVGDRRNKRVQVFDQKGKFLKQWTHLGTPWGVFVKGNKLYVVDGTENNRLYIVNTKDGKVLEEVGGLRNATAVTVDANDAIYIGEVNGTNVRKLVKKQVSDPPGAIKELIDNQRVNICEVALARGQQWPLQQYDNDTLMVALAPVALKITTADGRTETVRLKQGEVGFWPKGTRQAVEPENDARTIVAHFKEFAAKPYQNTTGHGPAFPRPRAKKLLENDRIGVWDYTWVQGQPTPTHFHDKDLMVVYMADGAIRSVTPDGKASPNEFKFAEVRFNLGNRAHYEEYLRGNGPRAIIIELK